MLFALLLMLLWVCIPLPAIAASSPSQVAIAQAAVPNPTTALERLFRSESAQADWFAPQFLQQISLQQIESILDSLKRSLGDLQNVVPIADGYELTFVQGSVPAKIELNPQGQIVLLFFGPPEAPISLEEAVSAVQNFAGDASLLVLSGDEVLAEVEADHPLAVGSAFKLAVLVALRKAIAQGTLNWHDVVTLEPEWRSLPSGLLQDWPSGTAITLETLATLMISLSDNTATDGLIHTLRREDIEALTPQNQPFLTTREFFALKNPANQDSLAAFRSANTAEQRQVLASLTTAPLPEASLFNGNPVALDVEWIFSARELCELMAQVQDLPLMGVNPGVAKSADWQKIAFKAGSEPGVLNLTTYLEAASDLTYCVSATWNDTTQPLDEIALSQLYGGILSGLASAQ